MGDLRGSEEFYVEDEGEGEEGDEYEDEGEGEEVLTQEHLDAVAQDTGMDVDG